MPIYHQCACGARIKLPDHVAGQKARCRKCQAIFVVPRPAAARVPAPPTILDKAPTIPNDGGLLDFESNSEPAPDYRFTRRPPVEIGIEDAEPAQGSSFWADLAWSFFFFIDGRNIIFLLAITFCHFWLALLGFGGIFGMLGSVVVYGYLCAFYFSTVLDTASGEDDLPTIWISDLYDDLIRPLFLFIGTWLVVLFPLILVVILEKLAAVELPSEAHWVLYGLGFLFWPAVVLMIAIGGGFSGLWPPLIVRTALAAPIAYLAVCATLLVAGVLIFLPETALFAQVGTRGSLGGMAVLSWVLNAYGTIVAMRAIGLYYRHFKHKLPWSAE